MGGILWSSKKFVNLQAENYYQNIISNELVGGNSPKEQVQLNIALTGVSAGAVYSVSILGGEGNSEGFRVIGITGEEAAGYNNKDIVFQTSFILDYFFEKQQNLVFRIHKDSKKFELSTTMGSIMGSRGQQFIKEIATSDDIYNKEKIIITGNTLHNNNINVNLNFSVESKLGQNYAIFYTIKKCKVNGSNSLRRQHTDHEVGEERDYFNIYKSEVQTMQNGRANFNSLKIPSTVLCNGNFENPILIEFHNFTSQLKIGTYETTVQNLLSKDKHFDLKGADVIGVDVSGDLYKEYTFLNYLKGGIQIALTIGVDFTASNGNSNASTSLHYLNQNAMNSYEKAIRSCGDIVAYYDYDQLFPVYGYGAVFKGSSGVNHCFPLNMNPVDPNINTIDGVLSAYRSALPQISLSGPTYFAPLINQFIKNIIEEKNKMTYHILMILTDGMINDMDDTIDALVEASYMPVSVIIIGIGMNDFGNMDILDADEHPLYDRSGRKAARDLVQFVPFYKFENNGTLLAEQVLEEIPRQLVEYYRLINMPPGDPMV